jgi:hypothetical protein
MRRLTGRRHPLFIFLTEWPDHSGKAAHHCRATYFRVRNRISLVISQSTAALDA